MLGCCNSTKQNGVGDIASFVTSPIGTTIIVATVLVFGYFYIQESNSLLRKDRR